MIRGSKVGGSLIVKIYINYLVFLCNIVKKLALDWALGLFLKEYTYKTTVYTCITTVLHKYIFLYIFETVLVRTLVCFCVLFQPV